MSNPETGKNVKVKAAGVARRLGDTEQPLVRRAGRRAVPVTGESDPGEAKSPGRHVVDQVDAPVRRSPSMPVMAPTAPGAKRRASTAGYWVRRRRRPPCRPDPMKSGRRR
jgi:hypothetical protein